jgi:VanZ family protein
MKWLRYKLPLLVWALTILVLTLMPGKNLPHVPLWSFDKLAHAFVFALLMLLALRAKFKQQKSGNPYAAYLFLSCVFYGMLIELIQNYIPGRSADFNDVIANTVGVLMGFLLYNKVHLFRKI